ncbi:RNA polymerase sigma factor [Microbacterium sp. KUDC0406]|uniref:RNA polymerase sigma factor n=1 Tax=Microbacterium sp. KUDC0406 TaxID=2909588 RepID=UPI001F273E64|nr:RNA polymerase sigma factor [Microbacterium sp. KUDC0406]UJP10131.1 RNA polymerase sigma factor [Microbacterium sp. KUDC0406]
MNDDVLRSRVAVAARAHAPALLASLSRRVDQPQDAADLLSETLLIVWRKAERMPASEDEIRPWMFGIAQHVLQHHWRSRARRSAIVERLREQLMPESGFAEGPDFDDLHAALRTLDPVDREIIALVHWDGFSLAEVAGILRMKESTVRSRHHRARARLRGILTREPVVHDGAHA